MKQQGGPIYISSNRDPVDKLQIWFTFSMLDIFFSRFSLGYYYNPSGSLQVYFPFFAGIPTCEEAPARNHATLTKDDGSLYNYELDEPLNPGDGITYNCEPNYIFWDLKVTSIRVQCGPDGTFPDDSLPQQNCRRKLCKTSILRGFRVVLFGPICVRFCQVMVFVPHVYQSNVGSFCKAKWGKAMQSCSFVALFRLG